MVNALAIGKITSEDGKRQYTITVGEDGRAICECYDCIKHGNCKHLRSNAGQSIVAYLYKKARKTSPKPRVTLEQVFANVVG